MMWRLLNSYQFLCCLVLFFLKFQINLSSSSSLAQLCSHDEASALIQFKGSLSIIESSSLGCDVIGIKSYPKTDSWKEGTDCCSWDGVTCDGTKGLVIGLDLSCSWLFGTIPSNSSLFHLPYLQKLNLASNNFFSSEMSSKFGEFASLVSLNLSDSSFVGQVPFQLSHLSKLVSLDISRNYYQTFDTHTLERLAHNLTELRQLYLDNINMSFVNPNVLMNLSSSLMSLSLEHCSLRGNLPENIFRLPNLQLLNLGYNSELILSLPKFNWSKHLELLDASYAIFPARGFRESIGNLISLKHLNLQGSQISGSISRALGNLTQLIFLDLSENNFTGEIPSFLFKNLTKLEFLYMWDNQLQGSLPDEVSAPILSSLDLSSNLLHGSLPSWLFSLSSLKFIYLTSNQFSGHIKEFQYNSLEALHLSGNKLQGHVPHSISQFLNLSVLVLSGNNLTGVVDFDMFSKLQKLEVLDLAHNSLSLYSSGTSGDYTLPNLQFLYMSACNIKEFPKFLRGSNKLLGLDLSINGISGKFPRWMQDVGINSLFYLNLSHNSLTNIEQLSWRQAPIIDLSSNLIHGDLPVPPSTAYVFLISNNSLSGKISSMMCEVSSLGILDLSHNNLSGIIPQCFWNLSSTAWMLSLRLNKFHGTIPPVFTKGCLLKNLDLSGNNFEGPLTRSIMNCRDLEVLDLGNNKINGTFPHWLGNLPALQVLVLRSNQLQGSVQDNGSNLSFSKIQIFDLSNNLFTGKLPVRYIQNFNAMVNLTTNESESKYLGVNQSQQGFSYTYSIGIAIKGTEIEVVKIFTKLTSIDLSNNKFQGEIPKFVGKLRSLKGLNLSHNNLGGCIPTSIGNLINLEWLDLSSNKLVGTIPETLTNLTYLSVFNVSENRLHGQIPQGKQFNTFKNDSYEGNNGLCGFPVSKSCSNNEPPTSNLLEKGDSKSIFAFGWKVVVIGYGCGVVLGSAMGYVVFQTGKPKWFVTLVEDQHGKRRKMRRIGNRRGVGRRI